MSEGAIPMSRPIPLGELPARPLVTVAITNYNYARFVGLAIESVLAQSYQDFEVVVVDDGSTDDSVPVIERYTRGDSRVRLVRKANGGMASSWNVAHRQSRGEVLCPLDADDAFHPRKLETLVEAFTRNPRSGLAVHAMTVLDGEGREVQRLPFLTRFERGWLAKTVVRRGGRWRYMPTSALAIRRELCSYLFPIAEETFAMHADALVVTLGPLLTEVIAVEEPLSYYRVHGTNSLGGGVRDRLTAEKVIEFTRRTVEGVNARLAELGMPERLDIARNLEYQQASFIQALFDGTPFRRLVKRYVDLAAMLVSDDLYGGTQKLLGLLVYGLAPLLPSGPRAWWIARGLGYSRLKSRVRGMIVRLKSLTLRTRSARTLPNWSGT